MTEETSIPAGWRVPEGVKLPDGTRWEGHHVRLERFEGPLDLLLFLVREQKVPIIEIPITTITDQFLEHVKNLQARWDEADGKADLRQLDAIGDFLVMAAVLIQIKARELLPTEEAVALDEAEMSKEDLIRLLEEYERFKAAAGTLENRMKERSRIFLRNRPSVEPEQEEILKVDLTKLLSAFREVLRKAPIEEVQQMAREPIPIEEMIGWIRQLLAAHSSVLFPELFPPGTNRERVIATFLALLEMMRSTEIVVAQAGSLGEIRITASSSVPAETAPVIETVV